MLKREGDSLEIIMTRVSYIKKRASRVGPILTEKKVLALLVHKQNVEPE